MDKYEKVEFYCGNLDEAVNKLLKYKEQGKLGVIDFNGVKLYSDTVTMDDAYLEVVGTTKEEHDKLLLDMKNKYEEELRLHEESIPRLTVEWIEKGHKVLSEDKWELWDECVPIRLNDLYRGWELKCCLDIVEMLNDGCLLDEAEEVINKQGHSVITFGLLSSMIIVFCDRGKEFIEYVNR